MRRMLGGTVTPAPQKPLLVGFNGGTSFSSVDYKIGFGWSSDHAAWTTQTVAKIAAGTGWESNFVKDPWLVDDGTQYVCYYSAYNGTNMAIGRATIAYDSFNDGSWTKYASNPVLSHGGLGDPDEVGCNFPVIHYDPADTPKWRMWYTGMNHGATPSSGTSTACYADSSDGFTWTKHGEVISLGAAGTFDDTLTSVGCVYKSGPTWYVYFSGQHNYSGTVKSRSAYLTCTDPSDKTTYSTATQLTNYTSDITIGSDTFFSNHPRGIMANGSSYICWIDLFNGSKEGCAQITSSDLTSWASPTRLMLPYESWDSISAENPTVILAH